MAPRWPPMNMPVRMPTASSSRCTPTNRKYVSDSASARRRPITVSGRKTRLWMSSARKTSRRVRAQAGALAASWRPERLIEKTSVTPLLEGNLLHVVDEPRPASADALVQHLRDTLAARADEPSSVLVHERALAAQPASGGVLRPHLPAPLARALVRQGIKQLYAHQVATVEAVRDGKNVVLASPTASGKSLAFALPTLERVLTAPGTRALYLYPTKALIGDQLRAIQALIGHLEVEPRPSVAVLTGDTPREQRVELAANPPTILLANPDILHHSLLPDHRRWRGFLANLGIVVIDELHSYRGVFGAHVALVLRRLRRLAAGYGARPAFVAASATIANPVELAEQVVGAPFVEVHGDTAGSGPRRFLFWRPPLRGDQSANEHESVFLEAATIFAEALRAGYSGILFGRARVSVERMLLDVQRLLGPQLAGRVSAYKSGYRADERAQIEAGLRSGQLRGVVSTNALELGIDVGALDVAVIAGYPGSTMSFWPHPGRPPGLRGRGARARTRRPCALSDKCGQARRTARGRRRAEPGTAVAGSRARGPLRSVAARHVARSLHPANGASTHRHHRATVL